LIRICLSWGLRECDGRLRWWLQQLQTLLESRQELLELGVVHDWLSCLSSCGDNGFESFRK
jgi:hypothetical protein